MDEFDIGVLRGDANPRAVRSRRTGGARLIPGLIHGDAVDLRVDVAALRGRLQLEGNILRQRDAHRRVLVLNVDVPKRRVQLQLDVAVRVVNGDVARDSRKRNVFVAGAHLEAAGDVATAEVAFIHFKVAVEFAKIHIGAWRGEMDALADLRQAHVTEAFAIDGELTGDIGDRKITGAPRHAHISGDVAERGVAVIAADLDVALNVAQRNVAVLSLDLDVAFTVGERQVAVA